MPKLRVEVIPLNYVAFKLPQLLKWYNKILLEVMGNGNVKVICSKKLKKVRRL